VDNQVERWFGLITQRASVVTRSGPFPTWLRKIEQFVTHYNAHPQPFMWTATADSILAKLERLSRAITGHHTSRLWKMPHMRHKYDQRG